MANRNAAGFGLIPSRVLGQTPATAGFGQYWIDAGDSTAIYNGEAVYSAVGSILGAQGSATTVKTLGGHGNGGKFYMRQMFGESKLVTYLDGKINIFGFYLVSLFIYLFGPQFF